MREHFIHFIYDCTLGRAEESFSITNSKPFITTGKTFFYLLYKSMRQWISFVFFFDGGTSEIVLVLGQIHTNLNSTGRRNIWTKTHPHNQNSGRVFLYILLITNDSFTQKYNRWCSKTQHYEVHENFHQHVDDIWNFKIYSQRRDKF